MNNTQNKHDKQFTHQENQQQQTRQQQEAKKQGQSDSVLHKDLKPQVHEHELPEMRMTR
jgi:hypothetical protein